MSEVKFEPFQRVMVRDYADVWQCDFYSSYNKEKNCYACVSGYIASPEKILPYNDETAHLLGTSDDPTSPEPEFKWGDHVKVRDYLDNDWQPAIYCSHGPNCFLCVTKGSAFVHDWRYCRHADW